ncbi:MAG TPA: hypothetical protein PKJ63_00385 [Cyclobacteriaceae bacterium]|nr:hypothetical protein [Cyclobacteriaceae bacterium]
MRTISNYRLLFLLGVNLLSIITSVEAQDKKFRARVSAQYVKITGKESSIRLSAKYRGEDGFEPATGLSFNVYKVISDDSLFLIGTTTTNDAGKAKVILTDSDNKYSSGDTIFNYVARIENNDKFEDSETSISFSDANLTAEVLSIDSTYQIKGVLTDHSGNPLPGQLLTVGLQRFYAPLHIGDEFYETDENGAVTVPLNEPMPAVDGILTFEISLNESDQYGTIQTLVSAPIGIPVKDESTFDQRTMWSPPTKTPYYLLIFPNLIILGVWVPIIILVINLFRISKTKINS